MYPFASLPENLASFCRVLRRDHGFRLGPGELRDAARALVVVDLADRQAVRDALRAVLCGSLDEVKIFDTVFEQFFLPTAACSDPDQATCSQQETEDEAGTGAADRARAARTPTATELTEASGSDSIPATSLQLDDIETGETALLAPSSASPLEDDQAEGPELPRVEPAWREAARSCVHRLQVGLSRRWKPANRGRRFDFRRTLRANLQVGGEPLAAHWLGRPRRTPRFVLLVDGSRSMTGYTAPALHVAVALAGVSPRVEVFTFSTGLKRVTSDVRRAAAGERRHLAGTHHSWAGGTSIGSCLADFLRRFGERMLGRDTVVMIASDGLDAGDAGLVQNGMRALHRRSAAIVWLNPLIETAGYEPTASGMRAARPFVDTFAGVADAAGLAELARIVRVRP